MLILARCAFVGIMLGLWFFTQRLIASRGLAGTGIQDKIHDWTAAWNRSLLATPARSRRLLILSSLGIDALGIYILLSGIFGQSVTPFIGLIILFSLRQLSQYLTALPAPDGMIWNHPGLPSLLVTYGVSNDLFFSGHTALAVFGGLQLAHSGNMVLLILGILVALFEIVTVLILRAHWTMDVYAGAVTAILVDILARRAGPVVDQWIVSVLA